MSGGKLEEAAEEIKRLARLGGDDSFVSFSVKAVDPLSLDELNGDELLDEGDDDLRVGAWLDFYRTNFDLEKGDVVLCARTDDGWFAVDVEGEADVMGSVSDGEPDLAAGWGSAGPGTRPAYRVRSGTVFLEGKAECTATFAFPSTILTLPEEAAPARERWFLLPHEDAAGGDSEVIEVRVGTDGRVRAFRAVTGGEPSRTAGSVQSLDGVTFAAA